jgi:glycerophosphoryl diester phosphodiesterase
MQCCYRYNTNVSNGVEISQRTPQGTWNVIEKAATTAHAAGGYNVIRVNASTLVTKFSIGGKEVLSTTATPYHNGAWGFQVRGLTMSIDYVRMSFTSNHKSTSLYTIPGGFVDVRDPETNIKIAPSLVTDIKTKAEFENILVDCPAIAIMNYRLVDGVATIVFEDGATTPDKALDKLGSKVIPAFRITNEKEADSLASFLKGRCIRDVYAVSSNLSALSRAYSNWMYIRGVADYSTQTNIDAESIRYAALENKARVLILGESTSRDTITKLQDSYSCVWLTISGGKAASVTATNKGPYGIITPDRSVTEYCYKTYYGTNTLIRRTNIIGHRGNPSQAPENTIYGTNVAYKNGANMVENDVYLSADNVVYVMHDEMIERTTNGTGSVLKMTSAQLKQYKVDYFSGVAAQAIPTLEDYFKEIKGKAHQKLVIEMKHPATEALAKGVADLIKKYDIIDQVVVISFIQQNLQNISKQLPGVAVGWLNWLEFDDTNPVYSAYVALEEVQKYNCVCNPGFSSATPRWSYPVIRELVYRGVTLWPWTINTKEQFDDLWLSNIGGITTDYSQYVSKYIESIHWNSGSRVISSTYQSVLTDITNSCEVVIIEDTLGIKCSAGNITVPANKSGKATFYYRYKSTTATGASYYMVTETRTIQVGNAEVFELVDGSKLSLASGQLNNVAINATVASIKGQFKDTVVVMDKNGNTLSDSAAVATGSVVALNADRSKKATIVIKGDVDGDGAIKVTDYLQIKSYLLKKINLNGAYLSAADCDSNSSVGTTDYVRLKSYFLKKYNMY